MPDKANRFFINQNHSDFLKLFDTEDLLLDKIIDEREAYLEAKELADLPSSEFSQHVNIVGSLTNVKFLLNPNLSEAPPKVLIKLTKRFLDLQVVRAEVMIMCFEKSFDLIFPIHVHILSNGFYDYRVGPPTVKCLIKHFLKRHKVLRFYYLRILRRRARWYFLDRFRASGRRYREVALRLKKRLLLSMSKAYTFTLLRILAKAKDEDEINLPDKSQLVINYRQDFGTIRSLRYSVASFKK